MATIYDKIDAALKRIKEIQDLITQGLARPAEKQEAFKIAKDTADLITSDIFKRKVEKLSRVSVWTQETRDGFVAPKEAEQLNPWIALFEEFKDARKVKTELSSDKVNIQSVVDGEDQHIFITEKGSGEHTHLILDGGTGEIRIDPKDKNPHELIKSVQAKLELKTGEVVQVTKSSLNFVEPQGPQPDVKAYISNKDDYFVLEVYNNGDEDLEDFVVTLSWLQPPPEGQQEKVFNQFFDETDYLVMAHPKILNMLKKGARVFAHAPSISVDKKLKTVITCKGMKSGKTIQKTFDLETKNQYPK